MKDKPIPGDVVRLNDQGMDSIGGLRSAEAVRQAQRMTIVYVGPNLTAPEPTYPIEVDQELINFFLLSHHDVDLIERPAVPLVNKEQPPILDLDQAVALGIATVTDGPQGRTITFG